MMVLDIDMFFIVCFVIFFILLCLSLGIICLLKESIKRENGKNK